MVVVQHGFVKMAADHPVMTKRAGHGDQPPLVPRPKRHQRVHPGERGLDQAALLNAALAAQAPLLGINNRDLTNFRTDVEHTFQLLPQCAGQLVISESGIKNGETARRLRQAGVRGILVGEGLVVVDDVAAMTREMALME